jgi:uncharacterized membrane protein YfcA
LIGMASVAILRRPRPAGVSRRDGDSRALIAWVFMVAIYGGYFGAAAGVLLLAVLLVSSAEPLARSNALKNAVLGLANAVAALTFVLFGPVHWVAVAPLAGGFLIGGRLGPAVVRRAPPAALRGLIALAGIGLAVHLGMDAYS